MIGEKFQEDNNTKHVAPTKVTDAAQAKNEAEAKNVEQPPLPPPPAAGAPPVWNWHNYLSSVIHPEYLFQLLMFFVWWRIFY